MGVYYKGQNNYPYYLGGGGIVLYSLCKESSKEYSVLGCGSTITLMGNPRKNRLGRVGVCVCVCCQGCRIFS